MSGFQFDLTRVPGSRIVSVARLAFGRPDTEFLCFGESDQPSPASALTALAASIGRGETLYPDVRGLPPLRHAIADYLTRLHQRPVDRGSCHRHRLRHGGAGHHPLGHRSSRGQGRAA
ncbi:hypothetical protein [Acidisoma sp.]|uniref:hypothetical protein n=1 Tax=Acidisoma sp. TaxID=1872115 RepID=UPI003AFFAD51